MTPPGVYVNALGDMIEAVSDEEEIGVTLLKDMRGDNTHKEV